MSSLPPDLHPVLAAALTPVLADVRSTGAPRPRVVASDWTDDVEWPAVMLHSHDGSASGVHVDLRRPRVDAFAMVVEEVQEWVIEELWATGSNWPVCPHHPRSHPMSTDASDGIVWWCCPTDGRRVAEVGTLGRPLG